MRIHRIHQRIALIDERDTPLLEIRYLEREYDEQPVHVLPELAVAALAGSPGLGRDVVEDFETGPVRELRNLEIEAGIVDQDDGVRPPGGDVGLAGPDIAQQAPGLAQHVADAHYRALAVMAHERAAPLPVPGSGGEHKVAAPEAYLRFRVLGIQPLHEVGPVKVARGLSCDYIVSHVRNRTRNRPSSSGTPGRGQYCRSCERSQRHNLPSSCGGPPRECWRDHPRKSRP